MEPTFNVDNPKTSDGEIPSAANDVLSDAAVVGLSAMNFFRLFTVALVNDGVLPGFLMKTAEVVAEATVDRKTELEHRSVFPYWA